MIDALTLEKQRKEGKTRLPSQKTTYWLSEHDRLAIAPQQCLLACKLTHEHCGELDKYNDNM